MYKVKLYLDGKRLDPSKYTEVIIHSPEIDRIVNEKFSNSGRETPVAQTVPHSAKERFAVHTVNYGNTCRNEIDVIGSV